MTPSQTLIIAEAGVNHNGDFNNALKLVQAAAAAKADFVKFQTFKAEKLVCQNASRARYQQRNTGSSASQLDMLRKLELDDSHFEELVRFCRENKVGFLSTPFDNDSMDFLLSLGMSILKIPSGEITNLPLLRHAAATRLPIIMSTGMCTLGDVENALNALTKAGTPLDSITLLHCTTQYPTPLPDVNLRAMETLRSAFGTPVGYSDHTTGIEVPVAAVALGASVIEKHFTLDKSLPGPDHAASLDPRELLDMVTAIRNIEQALGSPRKTVSPSEEENIAVARKSIVAKRPVARGEIFSEDNLTVKRPGDGLSPMLWDSIIGTRSSRSYKTDQKIKLR